MFLLFFLLLSYIIMRKKSIFFLNFFNSYAFEKNYILIPQALFHIIIEVLFNKLDFYDKNRNTKNKRI